MTPVPPASTNALIEYRCGSLSHVWLEMTTTLNPPIVRFWPERTADELVLKEQLRVLANGLEP